MNWKVLILILGLYLPSLPFAFGQSPILQRVPSIQVVENGLQMAFPFAGGLDLPQFYEMDLDGDGTQDLVVFDRAGDKILPFRNNGTPNTIDYDFAASYEYAFPDSLQHFAVIKDFNCDGKADIFTSHKDGMRVYEHIGSGSTVAYQVAMDTLFSDLGAGPTTLVVSTQDVPGFADVDNDGDVDILTFDSGGNFLEWHKNLSMENSGNCNSMEFIRAESCWGFFQESAADASISLGITCRVAPGGGNSGGGQPLPGSRHAGSTVAIFDEDGDGDKDLVIGDLTSNSLTRLLNGGTATAANITNAATNFPSYDVPLVLDNFPGAYFVDVNNDSKTDMVVAPNSSDAPFNLRNVWYYQNISTTGGVQLAQSSTRFLQKDMIDLGSRAYPTVFDYNNDGLLDLLVGNYSTKTGGVTEAAQLALFENVGTATLPAFELVDRDFGSLSTGIGANQFPLVPTLGDLDNDGDTDMIVGTGDGRLHYFENIAPTGQNASFVLSQANYQGIAVFLFAAPCLVDIDRDGLLDLIVGQQDGLLKYYRNTGTASQASFSTTPDDGFWGNVDAEVNCCTGNSVPFVFENPATGRYDLLLGTESNHIYYYQDIQSEFGGPFTLDDAVFGGIKEGFYTAATGADLNGDGKFEFITGNQRGGLGFYAETGTFVGGAFPPAPLPQFQLYPNPSGSTTMIGGIKTPGAQLSIKIFDLHGRQISVISQPFQRDPIALNPAQIKPGVYFVQVTLDDRHLGTQKWIVKE